ncbi:hypothetical protein [Sphingopyxis sp. DBS4]|uniref:hypothetical protein n=1 Tax=Sphingopyxis sp. DBS4 TaxID=2968500 RepID=UPI00214A928C|nr:hypothetical protein [Sphingopyxis sp. DBS4]
MRNFDFSSWQSIGATLLGLALFTLIGVGIRLVVMMTIQQRRERINRQINERLRTLIAAYKTLGGSFTGNLAVDPRHLRDLRRAGAETAAGTEAAGADSDRPRRIRDAVEAALSDIILLGTADQVRLASRAARELVEGRPVHVHDLVVALRDFIRDALDLDPVPSDSAIPLQGPTRPSSGGKGGGAGRGGEGGGGGGRGGGGGGMGGGMGMAGGLGVVGGASLAHGTAGGDDADDPAGLSKN